MIRIPVFPVGQQPYEGCVVTVNQRQTKPYLARVSAMPFNRGWPGHQRPLEQTEQAGFLSLESDGEVTLSVTWPAPPTEVLVRPLSRGVKAEVQDCTATFTLPGCGQYTVEADGFLYNMVRIMIGTLVDLSDGKRTPQDIAAALQNGDRQAAGRTAPAEGLILSRVFYDFQQKEA